MAQLLQVTKVIIFKISLLISVSVCVAYEYGYHPSAEEFDNLVRETRKTWTGDLLANERRRETTRTSPPFFKKHHEINAQVFPKFNFDKERNRYENAVNLNWPKPLINQQAVATGIVPNVLSDRYDRRPSAPSLLPLPSNIASTLDFTMFSDEEQTPVIEETNVEQSPFVSEPNLIANAFASAGSPTQSPVISKNDRLSATTKSPEIFTISNEDSLSGESNSPAPVFYKNHSFSQLPIFFTNPATGIVYAITEVGKVQDNVTLSNDSIPIYITKQQYDRDLFLQRKYYEDRCRVEQNTNANSIFNANTIFNANANGNVNTNANTNKGSANKLTPVNSSNASALSTPYSTTSRPQIIRLQKPQTNSYNLSKLPAGKVPVIVKKPSPVLVQSAINVVESSSTATRKKRPKIPKKKKKRMKKRKPATSRTPAKPSPEIIVGKRPTEQPTEVMERLSTQLEKPTPNIAQGTSIFSDRPLVSIRKTIDPKPIYRIRRQAVEKTEIDENLKILDGNLTALIENSTSTASSSASQPSITQDSQTYNNSLLITGDNSSLPRTLDAESRGTKKKPKPVREKAVPNSSLNKLDQTDTQQKRNQSSGKQKKKAKKSSTTSTTTAKTPYAKVTFIEPTVTSKVNGKTATVFSNSKTTHPKTAKKRKKAQKKSETSEEYDYGFTLFAGDEDEDDEVDDDSHDDDYDVVITEDQPVEDDEPEIFYSDKMPIDMHDSYPQYSLEKDEADITGSDLKSHSHVHASSSIEQIPEYGTLYVSDENVAVPSVEYIAANEIKPSKKRTRRRPSSHHHHHHLDYYDEDEDGGGVSSFTGILRMIFYPLQLVMEKIMDSYSGGAEKDSSGYISSSEEVAAIPAYTMYNNYAANKGDSIEAEEEQTQQGNSITDWFTSWFGFNRRTKKIGSTTVSPLRRPTTTEAPGWLDSWFNFGNGDGKTTTEASLENLDDDDDDDDHKWFFGWFDTKPKTKRKRDTTTMPTTTTPSSSLPQVPILTIVDPMRNPQNWIGILAHHIINSTATSTYTPLIEVSTRAATTTTQRTTTTTENPDIPRKISYDKHQIWRLQPQDDTQVRALDEYRRSDDGVKLHWLRGPSLRGLNDVLVPPRMLLDFKAALSFESIAHEVLIFDVGKAIAYEKSKEHYFYPTTTSTRRPTNKHQRKPALTMSWNNYYEYDDIIKYLESLRLRHPQLIELIHIGRSYEGRPLIIVKIESKRVAAAAAASAAAATANRKKLKLKKKSGQANAVFIEAGIHGMEWIGPATATWMINELLRIMKNNRTTIEQEYIKNTTWYILPVLNPDGYVYSHEYDRFWRKSRSRHISRPGGIITSAMTWLQQKKQTERVCYGVDLDRNWNYQWGRRGSSKSPCNEFYAGPVPFSELETKALSDFLLDYRKQIKLYISLQAYGQVLSFPHRANSSYNTDKLEDFLDVALVSTEGLRKKGSKSRYKIDSTGDLMARRAGCSDAFATYAVGIPFAYTLQLADNGVHGYLLPSSSIESTARDAFEIITAMIDYI